MIIISIMPWKNLIPLNWWWWWLTLFVCQIGNGSNIKRHGIILVPDHHQQSNWKSQFLTTVLPLFFSWPPWSLCSLASGRFIARLVTIIASSLHLKNVLLASNSLTRLSRFSISELEIHSGALAVFRCYFLGLIDKMFTTNGNETSFITLLTLEQCKSRTAFLCRTMFLKVVSKVLLNRISWWTKTEPPTTTEKITVFMLL